MCHAIENVVMKSVHW